MDTPDRSDGTLPAWPAAPMTTGLPQKAWDDQFEAGSPFARAITPRVIWRAFCRHWWQVLVLWSVSSAALAALAYNKIKPTYQSTAWLKVDPSSKQLLAASSNATDFTTSLETQVALITSPDVLSAAHAGSSQACIAARQVSIPSPIISDPAAGARRTRPPFRSWSNSGVPSLTSGGRQV